MKYIERLEAVMVLMWLDTCYADTGDELKAQKLNLAGFSNVEIADILEIKTEDVVEYLSQQ